MPPEIVQEAVEIVTMSVDKFINVKNYEVMLPLPIVVSLIRDEWPGSGQQLRDPCFGAEK